MSDYQVTNPSTGEVEKEFPTATDAEVQDALARSHAAYGEWRTTTKDERAQVLRRVADLYDERADELAAIIAREMGKPVREGKGEIKLVASIFRYYADQGPALLADAPLDPAMGGSALVRKESVGPLLGIMPWNFPYYQVARFAAPNLMVGNTILLKHAPQCPESALAIDQIFADAGLPADAYINLFATNEQSADIIADPRVVGRLGHRLRAGRLRRRRGRRAPPQEGRARARRLRPLHPARRRRPRCRGEVRRPRPDGQRRPGLQRREADDRRRRALRRLRRAVHRGDGRRSRRATRSTSPAASVRCPRRPPRPPCSSRSRTPSSKGATLRTGGKRLDRPGAFVEATVLTDVTPDMRAYREELFGPAAVVYRVADAAEAVALANDSSFGLGGVVWSSDTDAGRSRSPTSSTPAWSGSTAPRARPPTSRSAAPSAPGVGRELGPYGIDEFVNKKLIYTPAG